MKKTVITFNSITYAIKARKLLSREAIKARLIKLDPQGESDGCKYGLEISENELYAAARVLRDDNFEYRIRGSHDLS